MKRGSFLPLVALAATLVLAAGALFVADRTDRAGAAASPSASGLGCVDKTFVVSGTQMLTTIDQTTNTVVSTIDLGIQAYFLAISADGTTIAASAYSSPAVAIVDLATHAVRPLAITGNGQAVALSADARYLYLAKSDGFVEKWDLSTSTLAGAANVGAVVGGAITRLLLSPDQSKLYGVNRDSAPDGRVQEIDTATMTRINTPAGWGTFDFLTDGALTPDGSTLYVSESGTGLIIKMNASTGAFTSFGSFVHPQSVAISPDGATLFVGNIDGSPRSYFVRLSDETTTSSLPWTFNDIASAAYNAAGTRLYMVASDYANGAVVVFDAATQAPIAQIPLEVYGQIVTCPLLPTPVVPDEPVVPRITG